MYRISQYTYVNDKHYLLIYAVYALMQFQNYFSFKTSFPLSHALIHNSRLTS